MLLQYIPWKREWISQPHRNKWMKGRLQPFVSKTFAILAPTLSMLLQYIPWKRAWISQPHGNKWLNGRIQPSVSQTFPILFPPSLCCCKPFHKKDLRALCSNFCQQCAGFSRYPHATPKPVCAKQLCPEKGQSSISKGAHTADKNSLATAKLFYSMPFATAQKHTAQ